MKSGESIELWKGNIYRSLKDIADLESQKIIWLSKSPDLVSSFDEYIMALFDDFDITRFIHGDNWFKTRLPESLRLDVERLSMRLDNYQRKVTDVEILNDPDWQAITEEANAVIQKWNNCR